MAAFAYSAINAQGVVTSGELNANDLAGAREQLRLKGLLAQSIDQVESNDAPSFGKAKSVSPKSLQIFSRQFATMIEAGLNVVASLVILEEQTTEEALADVIHQLRSDVEGGLLLSEAMAKHPKTFSRLYISMVEAGAARGSPDRVV